MMVLRRLKDGGHDGGDNEVRVVSIVIMMVVRWND